jgi:dihydroneopterin aldolase
VRRKGLYEIAIEKLEFETIIGILDFERENEQKVRVDCFITYEDKRDFIDYAKVVEDIKSIMIEGRFELIEDALDSLIDALKRKYIAIKSIKITIFKPEILSDCLVSVTKLKKF